MDLQGLVNSLVPSFAQEDTKKATEMQQKGDTQGLQQLLSTPPSPEKKDAQGQDPLMQMLSSLMGFAPMGMAKVFKPGPQSFASLAGPGVQPLSDFSKMLPGLMDEVTGQISHSMSPGPYQHSALYGSIPKSWRPTPVWVDPQTWNAFTEKMLATLRGGF